MYKWLTDRVDLLVVALLVMVASIAVLFAGCVPDDGNVIIVTATPENTIVTPTVVFTPPPTIEPTPTQETGNYPSQPLNWMYELLNPSPMRVLDGSVETQCEPAGMSLRYIPGEIGTPMWINCDADPVNADGGLLRVEVDQRDGTYYYVFPFTFEYDECYGLNIIGSTDIEILNASSMDNLSFTAMIEPLNSDPQVDLGRKPIPRVGAYDQYWVITTDRYRPDNDVNVLVGWTADIGGYAGKINIQQITIRKVSPGNCDNIEPFAVDD